MNIMKVKETFDTLTGADLEGPIDDVIAELQKIKDKFQEFVVLNSGSPAGRTGIENFHVRTIPDEDGEIEFRFIFERDEYAEEKLKREKREERIKDLNEKAEKAEFERLTKKFTLQA